MERWNKAVCIHLTGGEPLLKPEIFPLLDYLNQEPTVGELGLITNGLCIDGDIVNKLASFSKLVKIKISLDGADAETNDAIRRKGVFDQILKTLPLLKTEKRFEMIFMLTVMKRNYRTLPSYLRLLREWGADGFIVERFIPWGRGRQRIDDVLEKREWNEVVQTLFDLFSAERDETTVLPFQAFNVRFKGEEMELLGAPCVVGVDGACVMPDGTVFPCRRFPVSLGNLLREPFKQIWETSALLATLRKRENLKGKCGGCDIGDCRGCRSLAFSLTGDYLAEDPHCGYLSRVASQHDRAGTQPQLSPYFKTN